MTEWTKCLRGRRFSFKYSKWARRLLLSLLILTLFPVLCVAERVSILYPEAPEPYNTVFEQIINGIREDKSLQIQLIPLKTDTPTESLNEQLKSHQSEAIISLGKRGFLAAQNLSVKLPTVTGALPYIPKGFSGISLAADPEQIFKKLLELTPEVKKVFVVSSAQSDWLIPIAQKVAKSNRIELISYSTDSVREAMLQYRQILENSRKKSDAIWLPLDSVTVNTDVVLPLLLKEAWARDLVIFSSNPVHVQRGTLFSMSPDYLGLGRELSLLLHKQIAAPETVTIRPTGKLQLAVNLRTAAHLDLSFNLRQQQQFNMTFPSR